MPLFQGEESKTTGIGMHPDELPHVFERFYRGDEARQGNGGESRLGLPIAKSIVELHRGTISVRSMPGQGTTFTIVLPVGSDGQGIRSAPTGRGASQP
jgi:signal transduction histidine kinase